MEIINQKEILENLVETYPYTVYYGFERTSQLDGDYETPNYFKSIEDAYYFIKNSYIVINAFKDKELDKKYEDYQTINGDISKTIKSDYYLLSLEKTKELYLKNLDEFKYVYRTPDNGRVYNASIVKTDINCIFDFYFSKSKNLIHLYYLGLLQISKDIEINDCIYNVEYLEHLYFGRAKITMLEDNKFIDYENYSFGKNNLKKIVSNFLTKNYISQIKNIDNFIDKLQKCQIKYLGMDDFINEEENNTQIIFQELLIEYYN